MFYNISMHQRFKEIRDHFDLTQDSFAKNLKVKRTTIANVESGRSLPSLNIVTILHNKYGINLNWLFCGTGKMKLDETKVNVVSEPHEDYGLVNELRNRIKDKEEIIKMKDELIEKLKNEKKEVSHKPAKQTT